MKKKTNVIEPSFIQNRVKKMLRPYSLKRTPQISVMRNSRIKNPL
jgi:hypothetical protein